MKLSDLAGPDADGWADVAVFVRDDGSESEPFVVEKHDPRYGIYYQHSAPFTRARIPTPSLYTVRRLGRGRLEPARIVMEGEAGRVAELESQVRAVRLGLLKIAKWHDDQNRSAVTNVNRLSEFAETLLAIIGRHEPALAATAPTEAAK